ncbi:hypothetical protein [Mesorhizobium silamurunense]|uniref:hypothetical protein n=1 Tax=Mesorhizobium silamurunense TaxID=499528 RepID=UPI001FE7038A|nr:hypothetical protein [Mesorhizobium silamurunense]
MTLSALPYKGQAPCDPPAKPQKGTAMRPSQILSSREHPLECSVGKLINDANRWRFPHDEENPRSLHATLALATSAAMAQSAGTSGGANASGSVSGGMNAGETVTGTTPSQTDTTTTSSTNKTNGMEDRCKDSGGYDTDNNTPSGAMTSDMQNCNK